MTSIRPPRDLRTEYLVEPLSLDTPNPRLFWKLDDARRGAKQSAYQVQVAESEAGLRDGSGVRWDSGKVASSASIQVEYGGSPLGSRDRGVWRVRVWDRDDKPSEWSDAARFELGLLSKSDWTSRWIGPRPSGGPYTGGPCPHLRKEFDVKSGVVSARLYISALGIYEAHLNGQRVGNEFFTPGWTEYEKRVPYQAYDVTALVQSGKNALGVILGDGWYAGHVGPHPRGLWGEQPELCAQLELTLSDGRRVVVASDESWKLSSGPLLEADMLMGETYDARRELVGWDRPGFDDTRWSAVETFEHPALELSAHRGVPVRRMGEIQAKKAPTLGYLSWGKKGWIFDLEQNMVGFVRLKARGPKGRTITLRHAEVLNPDGTLYLTNLRGARAIDRYTKRTDGEEIWEPRFTFHGFRYVEVSGCDDDELPLDTVTGVVVHSDTPKTGEFECSEPLVNQLQSNTVWSQKGNFLEVPTDCPQRDERLGWTGDAQVFARTAAFNMDVAAFFAKWQRDVRDSQTAEGTIPPVVPFADIGDPDGGPAWSDAALICPWTMYLCYADKRLLEENYDVLSRFVSNLETRAPDGIRSHPAREKWGGFGDWLSTNADTPKDLIGTAFLAHSASLMQQVAERLGKSADAQRYGALLEKVKAAFQRRFVTPDGFVLGHTQTGYVLALHFDLLPANLRKTAIAALVQDIRQRDCHLSTGFVGTPYLLHVLSDAGELELCYRLLMQKTFPSWLYPVLNGATTIWERWDGWTEKTGFQSPGMNSFNHYAYGAVGSWLYQVVAGLELDPKDPGYARAILRPRPGGGFTHARASLETLFGRFESSWKISGSDFVWSVRVPPNARASVYVPAKEPGRVREGGKPLADARFEDGSLVSEIGAGSYEFVSAGWKD